MYTDDELLPLSGIQHIAFCERQWALIHIERQWAENVRTVEGHLLHERVDDPFSEETRVDLRISRSVPVISRNLGLQGVVDVVEFQRVDTYENHETITMEGMPGRWRPRPVEYKRGRPKPDERDAVQLCAQAIALEEMLKINIFEAHIFYWQVRRREIINIDNILKQKTKSLADRMHELFSQGITPAAVPGKRCSLCSLEEICQPKLTKRHRRVSAYIERMLSEDS